MNKNRLLVVGLLAALLFVAFGVVRGRMTRELFLSKNGVPMANLRADILPLEYPDPGLGETSTDADGQLDLTSVPARAPGIAITLRDDTGIVFNGSIRLPRYGSCRLDIRDNGSASTTTKTYVDLVWFKWTGRDTEVWTQH
jgi:hypothetical protein